MFAAKILCHDVLMLEFKLPTGSERSVRVPTGPGALRAMSSEVFTKCPETPYGTLLGHFWDTSEPRARRTRQDFLPPDTPSDTPICGGASLHTPVDDFSKLEGDSYLSLRVACA